MLTRHHGQFNIIGRQRKYGLLNRLGEWVRPLVYDAILPINQRGNNRFACIRRGKTEFYSRLCFGTVAKELHTQPPMPFFAYHTPNFAEKQ